MTSTTSSVRSIRLQNDVWAWLGEEAGRRGVTVNGLVSDLIEVARLRVAETKAKAAESPAPRPAPKAKPAKPEPFKTRLKGEWKAP